MRVLIADRNARLLEAISRTFARDFTIRTAASCEQCNDLLTREEFDLALVSEKLADGPGLQLLAQIARTSPDMLRVFAARRSRLQLLKGKLGPFGLFRTLGYPINPQELLSTLTLARTGLAIGASEPVSESSSEEAPDVQAQTEILSPPASPAEVPPVVERISLTSADATFTINVPETILSQRKVRRSKPAPAHRPTSAARQAPPPVAPARNTAVESAGTARQGQKGRHESPGTAPQVHQPRGVDQQAPVAPRAARTPQHSAPAGGARAAVARSAAPASSQTVSTGSAASVSSQAAVTHSAAAASSSVTSTRPTAPARSQGTGAHTTTPVRPPAQSEPSQYGSKGRRAPNRPVVYAPPVSPIRSKIVLAAASVVVFLVTTLTLNLNDASVHVTRASTPPPKTELPPAPEPPAPLAPAFRPEPSVARRVEPKPAVDPKGEQVTASNAPIADPSTFAHEAYEVIYAN